MPTYVYFCETCEVEFEAHQSFSAKPLSSHDVCGGKARKVFLPASIVFKGSGFYVNDSRNATRSTSRSTGKSTSSNSDASSSTSSDKSSSKSSETSSSSSSSSSSDT